MQKVSAADTGRGFTIGVDGRQATSAAAGPAPTSETMQELAEFLTFIRPHQTVIDKTGLEGRYKFALRLSTQPPGGDHVFEDLDIETALQRGGAAWRF